MLNYFRSTFPPLLSTKGRVKYGRFLDKILDEKNIQRLSLMVERSHEEQRPLRGVLAKWVTESSLRLDFWVLLVIY